MPIRFRLLPTPCLMPGAGFEPAILSAKLFKTFVYTGSTTQASYIHLYCPSSVYCPGMLYSFQAPINLTRFVREHQIELIHAHLTRATYMGLLAGRLAHLPFVCSVHCRTHDVAYRYLFPSRRSRIITVSDFLKRGLLH